MKDKEIDLLAEKLLKKIQEKQVMINSDNPFKKTLILLKDYNRSKSFIEINKNEIEALRKGELPKKSAGIITGHESGHEFKSEFEKREDKITFLEETIAKKEKRIMTVDLALGYIKDEKYHEIIPLFYFDNCSIEDIAEELEVDTRVVTRNKKKLIEILSVFLFD